MPQLSDFPARGRVKSAAANHLVFQPSGTNYELHLTSSNGPYSGLLDQPTQGTIRVSARKIWSVPSGGNFIAPIFGPPKIIQGRVTWIDGQQLVVHAGTNFIVELPPSDMAIDLASGAISIGTMVNVTALPGATFAFLQPAVASSER